MTTEEPRTAAPWWTIAVIVLWGVAGVAALVPAMFTPMLFDATGSTESVPTVTLAVSVATFPLVCWGSALCLIGVRIWTRIRGVYPPRLALGVALAPVLSATCVALAVAAIGVLCDGKLVCA